MWILHRLAVRHIGALEEILREMSARGKDVRVWEGAFAIWSQVVFAWPRGWGGQNTGGIDKTSLDHLQTLASWLDDYLPKADAAGLERTGRLVDDVLNAVNDDDSLPADMKIHLRQMCDQLRWCLDGYSQTGDFELKVAIDRLLITVGQSAQHSSTFRDKVTVVVNTFVYPFVVGTLAQVTGGAILSVLGLSGGAAPPGLPLAPPGPTPLPPAPPGPIAPPPSGGG
ncbi:hypothetical protein MPRS_54790 [Mycobacterium paraseoulense]|uniref:Uncharacterized protein n=1 Tax=Mycobacterium paraseoulense TaxID=590652 RepID=A0A1X0I9N1_9MYCO|nr:hypothetical protein BST39_15785 [Mycobacterium paraseoulense]BBZ74386.1 hypothetical protein MPRS_54790 [Mycobacterium paraseoulense]